jgi:hypothetical protein
MGQEPLRTKATCSFETCNQRRSDTSQNAGTLVPYIINNHSDESENCQEHSRFRNARMSLGV